MRRRPPRLIHLSPEEVTYLKGLVRDGRTEQRIARRVLILLEMADPATIVSELGDRLGQDRRTIWALCRRFEALGVDVVKDSYRPGRPRELPPLQRVEVERLACSEPAGLGLHMTHWSTRSLARAARQRGIAPAISHSTVAVILRDADLQLKWTPFFGPPSSLRFEPTPT